MNLPNLCSVSHFLTRRNVNLSLFVIIHVFILSSLLSCKYFLTRCHYSYFLALGHADTETSPTATKKYRSVDHPEVLITSKNLKTIFDSTNSCFQFVSSYNIWLAVDLGLSYRVDYLVMMSPDVYRELSGHP